MTKDVMKAQLTTAQRSDIMMPQQCHWHKTLFLIRLNRQNVTGRDETCFLASDEQH